jgi:hypothetical protein
VGGALWRRANAGWSERDAKRTSRNAAAAGKGTGREGRRPPSFGYCHLFTLFCMV